MYCYISLFTFFVCMGYVMGKVLLPINLGTMGVHTFLQLGVTNYKSFTLTTDHLLSNGFVMVKLNK